MITEKTDINALHTGTIISDRYTITEFLSRGGFGITYAATDTLLNHRVAIKEFFPESMVVRGKDSDAVELIDTIYENDYKSGLEKFLGEARTLVKFNKESGIVHVLDYVETNNTAYMIMEFIDGCTLEEYIGTFKDGKVPDKESVRIISSIATLLSKIHKEGIIHRDISPENIMIDKSGEAKLIDFGAARAYVAGQNQNMTTVLKADYAPPEQFMDASIQDEKTDIYALGAVAYRLLTGVMPDNSMDRMLHDNQKSCSQIRSDIPLWLSNIVDRCMSLKAKNRYDSVAQLEKDLSDQAFTTKRVKSSKITLLVVVLIAVLFSMIGVAICVEKNVYRDMKEYEYSGVEAIETNGPIALLEKTYYENSLGLIIKNCDEEEYLTSVSCVISYGDQEYDMCYPCLIAPGEKGFIDAYFYDGMDFSGDECNITIGTTKDMYTLTSKESLNRTNFKMPQAYISSNNEIVVENPNAFDLVDINVYAFFRDSSGKMVYCYMNDLDVPSESTEKSGDYDFGTYSTVDCYVDISNSIYDKSTTIYIDYMFYDALQRIGIFY